MIYEEHGCGSETRQSVLTLETHLVSNGSLSNAAIKVGLSPYILTTEFTQKKWRPTYVSPVLGQSLIQGKRELSTKLLADVVESLIGAAFQDGGYPKAIECLKIFLPDLAWTKAAEAHDILLNVYPIPVSVTFLTVKLHQFIPSPMRIPSSIERGRLDCLCSLELCHVAGFVVPELTPD